MPVKSFRPLTPSSRYVTIASFDEITKAKPERNLIEILARCKKTVYTQREGINAIGERTMRQIPESAPAFPFSVTRDDNPRGREWLLWTLAQP